MDMIDFVKMMVSDPFFWFLVLAVAIFVAVVPSSHK